MQVKEAQDDMKYINGERLPWVEAHVVKSYIVSYLEGKGM